MSFDESINASINAYFVRTTQSCTSSVEEDLTKAQLELRNHVPDEHIRQIKASEGFPLIASGRLTKKDVFVFDRFEGDFFKQLQQTKSLIVGPRCLIACLLKCEPIPLGTSPVYTTAMRDLQISATGISPQEKEQLRVLIQWMGGHYFQNFGRTITHLISNTIKSKKYEHATLNGIAVMHVDWVQRVWERSCLETVSATDEEFDRYKLPIFFATNITCTGLETDKKNEVMRLVNDNGGTFHRAFRSQLVDIVITEKSKTNSDKYLAAVRYKKDILLPEWIFDSVEKGFALPTKTYQVKSLKVSTPTKSDRSIADFSTCGDNTQLSDLSRISVASGTRRGGGAGMASNDMTTVNDTICSLMNETVQGKEAPSFAAPAPVASKELQRDVLRKTASNASQYRLIYDDICPKQAKKAGAFLDGCCIYLSGFRLEEREKLNRILNVGGATRYDVVNEKITHIIVGQLDDSEFRTWKKDGLLAAVNIVRLDWLLQSIKHKQPASEMVYRVSLPVTREPDAPSPSSKKTLRSMNHSFKQPDIPIKKKLFDTKETAVSSANTKSEQLRPMATSTEMPMDVDEAEAENNLIAQYSQENVPISAMPQPPLQTTTNANDTTLLDQCPIASSTQCVPNGAPPTPAICPNPSELTEACMSTIDYDNLDMFQGIAVYVDKDHFPEEFYTQMINECEAAQGNVVTAAFRDPVDYAIVSFERTLNVNRLPVEARHIVTELYVETCLKQNKLVPIEYYHKHIPDTADSLPLEGMTIVISIYTGLERDFIDSIAQLLGARVNKTFVKKEKPLLVCPTPEGSKYEGALKWRFPVVTSDWLVQCAVRGEKLLYQTYLVGDSPLDFPISPALRERNVDIMTPCNVPKAAVDIVEKNVVSNAYVTPTTASDFTPLRNKRVSELAGPGIRSNPTGSGSSSAVSVTPESPHTPLNKHARHSHNFDIMDSILAAIENDEERESLREVIEEMRNNQTPELERLRRQACTPRKLPTPKGIPDFCTTPAYEQRMADEFERRWRLPSTNIRPDTPIDVLRRRILRATCKAMGIPFNDDNYNDDEPQQQAVTTVAANSAGIAPNRTSLDASVTPLQHQHKITRHSGMAPRSIFAQLTPNTTPNTTPKSTTRTSDTFVPCTQTLNSSGIDRANNSGMNTSGLGQRASLVEKSTINFDKISFEETAVGAASTTENRTSRPSTSSPEIKQITDYLRNCESRRQSMKRSASRGGEPQSSSSQETMETESNHHYVQPFESEQFCAGTEEMVGWRDPVEFGIERGRTKAAPAMNYKGTPLFSISCSEDALREETITKILQLGGEVCENLMNYDPACTHFVCERPNRGEKTLGCIASGKWVLSLKYIEECFAKDIFIDEELYEWGNCKALNLPQLTQDEQVIALAAHRWRVQLSGDKNGTGAFSGFRAILRIAERNLVALQNVIKAGKGEIIEARSPYNEENGAQFATHCFVDVKKVPLTQPDFVFLRSHNVNVLTQIYINSFLMNGSDADFDKYAIKM